MDRMVELSVIEAHGWLKPVRVAHVAGPTTPLLDEVAAGLLEQLRAMGHTVLEKPAGKLDVLLTTALFGKPLSWRSAPLFTARRQYRLEQTPTVFTLLHITPSQLAETLAHFAAVLPKDPPDPQDYAFAGLTDRAYRTLVEQGRRGGPLLALVRLAQSQALCIRIILVVGQTELEAAYTFDLVGAHPRTSAADRPAFYADLVNRILTAVSTKEITHHEVVGAPLDLASWQRLTTPAAMKRAGQALGARGFFTEMVRVADLVAVPAVHETISSQYSEGCFATWDPDLGALIATVTGSARPVDKENLTDDELALIVGVRPDGQGALVRQVQGKRNDPPSSEAVELILMDGGLPQRNWLPTGRAFSGRGEAEPIQVPVARSKLHGHRGVRAFDPALVEHVYLDRPFYHYPVSCSTEAQAHAIQAAFGRSQALRDALDPRQVVFTVLPGHGIVIVEKWREGREPFQLIWEAMDSGQLEVENAIPQGPLVYEPAADGRLELKRLN
jgi:hypothetical protein